MADMAVPRPTVLVAILLAAAGAARADTTHDALGPREIGLGDSRRGGADGTSSVSLNPSGVALERQLVFEGSYGYRGVDGLSAIGVVACDATVPVPGCFYYRYLTAEPDVGGGSGSWRTHELGATVAYALSPMILAGINLHWFDHNSDLPGDDDARGFGGDAGVTVRPSDLISIGVAGYNLVAEDTPRYPLGVGVGVAVRPMPGLAATFDAAFDLDRDEDRGKGRYGGGVEYFLTAGGGQTFYPLRAGGAYDAFGKAGYVTGGLGMTTLRVSLDLAIRAQVSGVGDEVMFVGGLRMFGPTGE